MPPCSATPCRSGRCRGDRAGQFARLLKADAEVAQKLNPAEIDAMFDDFYHLKHVDAIFERVFGKDS